MGDRRFRTGSLGSQFGASTVVEKEPEEERASTRVQQQYNVQSVQTLEPAVPNEPLVEVDPYAGIGSYEDQNMVAGTNARPPGWRPGLPVVTSQTQSMLTDMSARFLNGVFGRTPTEISKTQSTVDFDQIINTRQQFGIPPQQVNTPIPGQLGWDGTLTQGQLTESARLTAASMFQYGEFPIKISTDLANELPYNPKSKDLQAAFLDAFGVPGFASSEEMLIAMNYFEYAPGKWWRSDEVQGPTIVSSYGYADNGYGSRGGYSSAPRGNSYTSGGLINWRIGV